MQSVTIGPNEAGQRFDKFLHKYLPNATTSFLYKMLRKKNITLNGKKAEGNEILKLKDEVKLFFAEETFEKFSGRSSDTTQVSAHTSTELSSYYKAYQSIKGVQIIYEDEHILLLNKPAGLLTQKAQPGDLSLNEWMIGYLLQHNAISAQGLTTFKPSVVNRLDRNTSGLVLCGKSLTGSQSLSGLIKGREVRKFYRTVVLGKVNHPQHIHGYLLKDAKTNKVTISNDPSKGDAIETAYTPITVKGNLTYLEVELITGKTHQIRAHLSHQGHPLCGDPKYGMPKENRRFEEVYGLRSQLLHAYRLEFPKLEGALSNVSEKVFTAPLPSVFEAILKER